MNKNEYITVDGLATILNVPKTKIYNLTREKGPGSIPRYRVGKYIRFNLYEVIEWMEAYNKVNNN